MTAEVILVGCLEAPEGDGDEGAAEAALADLGLRPRWASWDDPAVDFGAAEVVVLRAAWDYPRRRQEFLDWCEGVPALCNAAPVVRWSTDKRYLTELLATGVAVVPTELVEPGEVPRWPGTDFVLKPVVGVGSIGTRRFAADETGEAAGHLTVLHENGLPALLQPYQSSVDTAGETAVVFFGGVYSHAFAKQVALPGGGTTGSTVDETGLYLSERLGSVSPSPVQRRLAEDALDAAAGLLGILRAELLYARVDLVDSAEGSPLVLELELAEPSLGFRQADSGAALRFASAVRQQLA